MSYAYYERDGMERGYSVDDTCHAEDCDKAIDRGLSYLCYRCTEYFCEDHRAIAFDADGDTMLEWDCFAGTSAQCCKECADDAEANQ